MTCPRSCADSNSDVPVRATLILRTATNAHFVAMQKGAQEAHRRANYEGWSQTALHVTCPYATRSRPRTTASRKAAPTGLAADPDLGARCQRARVRTRST